MKNQLILLNTQLSLILVQAKLGWHEDLHPRAKDGKFGSKADNKKDSEDEGSGKETALGDPIESDVDGENDPEEPSKEKVEAYKKFIAQSLQPEKSAKQVLRYAKDHPGQMEAGAVVAAVAIIGISPLGRQLLKAISNGSYDPIKEIRKITSASELPEDVAQAYSTMGNASMSDELKVALFNLEEKNQSLPHEELFAFDESGEEFLSVKGNNNSVQITAAQQKKIKDHPTGILLTHNHPKEKLPDGLSVTSSLSPADIQIAFQLRLREMRAFTDEHIYVMRPGKGKDRLEEISQADEQRIDTILETLILQLRTRCAQGQMSKAQAEHELFHRVWTQVSAEMPHVMQYEKITKGS